MWRVFLALALAALWLAPAFAASDVKHSGQLVAVSPNGGAITVQEMGPWRASHTSTTRHVFDVTSSTKVEAVTRSKKAGEEGWLGGFTEAPLTVSDLKTGEYVTVTATKEGTKMVADSIQVVRPGTD